MTETSKVLEKTNCIYCLEEKISSKEHVLPASLGGNLTIRCVCKDCNVGLSFLDQSLVDSSLLSLVRLSEHPGAALASAKIKVRTNQDSEILESRLGYRLIPSIKPQIFFQKNESSYQIRAYGGSQEDFHKFFNLIRKYISRNKLNDIQTLSAISSDLSESCLVMHRSNEIVFRPSSKALDSSVEKREILKAVAGKIDEFELSLFEQLRQTDSHEVVRPSFEVSTGFQFGLNLRAISKIALNFLAYKFGEDLARSLELHALRKYVRFAEGENLPGAIWNVGTQEDPNIAASRFAIWIHNEGNRSRMTLFSRPGTHTIQVHYFGDRYLLLIEFYNWMVFAVDLGLLDLQMSSLPAVHEFDYLNKQNRCIQFIELAEQYRRTRYDNAKG